MRTALIDADWRPIAGFEGCYAVSSFGVIQSLPREEVVKSSRTGGHVRCRSGRIMKTRVGLNGREFVALRKGSNVRMSQVHRLVAEAFIPNPEDKPEVNHKDGNPLNNHVDNLEWCTRRENIQHAIENGLTLRGQKVGTSKLVESDVIVISLRLLSGETQTSIAKDFNVSNHAIHKIACGDNWSWLTGFRKEV